MEIPVGARIVRIKCFPDAGEDAVVALGSDRYEVYVRAPAQDGRANERMLWLLARHLVLPEERLRLLSGHQNRHKIVIIGV